MDELPSIPSASVLTVAGSWALIAFLFIKGVIGSTAEAAKTCNEYKELLNIERAQSDKWEQRYLEREKVIIGWAQFGLESLRTAKEVVAEAKKGP
jgi:hypothetical protein